MELYRYSRRHCNRRFRLIWLSCFGYIQENTVVVIEHNLDVIKSSDWVIDLGPEGGEKGGFVLFEGTVDDLLKKEKNDTASCLKTFMKK